MSSSDTFWAKYRETSLYFVGATRLAMSGLALFCRVQDAEDDRSTAIRNVYRNFFEEVGVRADIRVCLGSGFAAEGMNDSPFGDAKITVISDLHTVCPPAFGFLLKHETAHILNNDSFMISIVPAIIGLTLPYFAGKYLPKSPILKEFFVNATSFLAYSLFSIYREGKADDFAISHSSDEELEFGRRFFTALKYGQAYASQTSFLNKLMYSSEGETRYNTTHPTFRSRIDKIENAMLSRGLPLTPISAESCVILLTAMNRHY